MKKPSFSILIPAYNAEKTIGRCLQSILSQHYDGEYEILVFDDCPTDKTPDIVKEYSAKHTQIRLITGERNNGVTYGRFVLMQEAAEEYILFVDADDTVSKQLLPIISKYAASSLYDMIIFDYMRIKKIKFMGELYKRYYTWENRKSGEVPLHEVYESLAKERVSSLWQKAFKRKLFAKEKDFSSFYSLTNMEDMLLTMEILKKSKNVGYIQEALYNYYTNPDSITHNISINNVASARRVLSELKGFITERDCEDLYVYVYERYLAICLWEMKLRYRENAGKQILKGLLQEISEDRDYCEAFHKVTSAEAEVEMLFSGKYAKLMRCLFWDTLKDISREKLISALVV